MQTVLVQLYFPDTFRLRGHQCFYWFLRFVIRYLVIRYFPGFLWVSSAGCFKSRKQLSP